MSLTLIQKIPMVINKDIYSYIDYKTEWKNKMKDVNKEFRVLVKNVQVAAEEYCRLRGTQAFPHEQFLALRQKYTGHDATFPIYYAHTADGLYMLRHVGQLPYIQYCGPRGRRVHGSNFWVYTLQIFNRRDDNWDCHHNYLDEPTKLAKKVWGHKISKGWWSNGRWRR
jgi:hypothetical protein